MTKQVNVKIIKSPSYADNTIDEPRTVSVYVWVEGNPRLFGQTVSEYLQECPEDAVFGRDLPDPVDVVTLLKGLLGDDPNYQLNITSEIEE